MNSNDKKLKNGTSPYCIFTKIDEKTVAGMQIKEYFTSKKYAEKLKAIKKVQKSNIKKEREFCCL